MSSVEAGNTPHEQQAYRRQGSPGVVDLQCDAVDLWPLTTPRMQRSSRNWHDDDIG